MALCDRSDCQVVPFDDEVCAQVLGGVMSLRAHGERVLVKLVFDADRYDRTRSSRC